jgi:3,4-dihydroxyphenylacetate 2,3-dioxygenase
MGSLVLAAKITHVPSIWLSLQTASTTASARERGVDTFVIADTHSAWSTAPWSRCT